MELTLHGHRHSYIKQLALVQVQILRAGSRLTLHHHHGHRRIHHRRHRSHARKLCRRGWCGHRICEAISIRGALYALMNILNVVHGVDGSIGIGLLAVADKAKATAAASVTVLDDDLQGTERLVWLFSISKYQTGW